MPKEYPRKARLNAQFQVEISDLIRNLSDARLSGITVTEVDVAPDLRNATVKISRLTLNPELAEPVKLLNQAAGLLRGELGRRLKLRAIPVLHFRADLALAEGDHIHKLIRQAVDEDRRHHPEASDKPDDQQ